MFLEKVLQKTNGTDNRKTSPRLTREADRLFDYALMVNNLV